MELTELQNVWLENNRKLDKSLRINRELMEKILREKPERRIKRITIGSAFELILPLILLPVFIPQMRFRNEFDFYLGSFLFGAFSILTYTWAVNYFVQVTKINLSNQIVILKKQIAQLEKHKLKSTRLGYLLSPLALLGICLIGEFRLGEINLHSLFPLLLMVVVLVSTVFITFKYSIFERFRKLNQEIADLENLRNDAD